MKYFYIVNGRIMKTTKWQINCIAEHEINFKFLKYNNMYPIYTRTKCQINANQVSFSQKVSFQEVNGSVFSLGKCNSVIYNLFVVSPMLYRLKCISKL